MEEVKKNKKKNKVASLLLALALILTCGVAGTIAQYQKSFNGNATATVAKFNVTQTGISSNKFNLFDTVYDTASTGITENDVASNMIAPGTQGYKDLQITNNSEVNVELALTATLSNGTGKVLAGNSKVENSANHVDEYIPLQFAVKASTTAFTAPSGTSDFPTTAEWSTLANAKTDPAKDLSTAISQAIAAANTNSNKIGQQSDMYVRVFWKWAYNTGKDGGTTQEQKDYDDRNELDTIIGEAINLTKNSDADGEAVFKAPVLDVKLVVKQAD